jgi:hypothetical protein
MLAAATVNGEREDTMKALVAAVLAAALIAGCVARVEKPAARFDEAKALAVCEKLVGEFQATLKNELISALEDGGPEGAVSVCNLQAPVIAYSMSQKPGVSIKRVSLLQRNQHFKPDSLEAVVLGRFAAIKQEAPQVYSELTIDSAGTRRFHYLKEIKVDQICLNCHGNPDRFSAELKTILADKYPGDRAVGYAIGDSRGAFSVTLTYPEAAETVTMLLPSTGR